MNAEWRMANGETGNENLGFAVLVAVSDGDGGGALREVLLAPDGEVHSVNGDFVVDEESGRLAVEAFEAHGTDLPIDYEHHTLGGEFASPDGRAPAAGWIKKIRYQKGNGLFATVEWTQRAREYLRAKEYRYLSPVAVIRKKDRKLVGIHSAALTNKPAIPRMEALAAKVTTPTLERDGMKDKLERQANQEPVTEPGDPGIVLGQIASTLEIEIPGGADITAALQTILEGVKKLKGGGGSKDEGGDAGETAVASKEVLAAFGLKGDASNAELVALAETYKVTKKRLDEQGATLKALQDDADARKADELLEPYFDKNVLNPHNKEQVEALKELAREDPKKCKVVLDGMTPYAAPGRTTAPPRGGGSNNRETIIANKTREFHDDPNIGRLTGKAAWVGEGLREKGLEGLTEKEREALN